MQNAPPRLSAASWLCTVPRSVVQHRDPHGAGSGRGMLRKPGPAVFRSERGRPGSLGPRRVE